MYYLNFLIDMCLYREKIQLEKLTICNIIMKMVYFMKGRRGRGGGAIAILIFCQKRDLTFLFTHCKNFVLFQEFNFFFMEQQNPRQFILFKGQFNLENILSFKIDLHHYQLVHDCLKQFILWLIATKYWKIYMHLTHKVHFSAALILSFSNYDTWTISSLRTIQKFGMRTHDIYIRYS